MRLFLIFFPFFTLFSTPVFSQNVKLTGKVTGEAVSIVKEIQIIADGRMNKFPVEKETGVFSGEIELKEPQFLELKTGSTASSYFFCVPEETFHLVIDKPTLHETLIEFSEGNTRKLFGIWNLFYKAIDDQGISTLGRDWHKDLFGRPAILEEAFRRARENMMAESLFLESYAPTFLTEFGNFENAFRNYIMLDELPLKDLEDQLISISQSEMKVTVLTIPFYREYLIDLSNAYAARTLEKYDIGLDFIKEGYKSQFIAAEAIGKYITNKRVINNLFYDKINRELVINGYKNAMYMDYLLSMVSQSVVDQFAEKIQKLKEKQQVVQKEGKQKVFDFLLLDAQGKEYRPEDFKGKMVFIDFWASWCAPCKAQMPHLKELEKIYHGKDIIFASVSLDNTQKAWLKGVESEKLEGTVLWAEGAFKNPFPIEYGIQSIPRFMLIDANGFVISDDMPKPQNKKEVMTIIDAELFKAELEMILDNHYIAIGAEKLKSDNLLYIELTQKIPGFETKGKTWYNFPGNLRFTAKMEENPTMIMMLGREFFKERYFIMSRDTFFGNEKALSEMDKNWYSKINGFELYLKKELKGISLEFAEENADNKQNQYVLRVKQDDIEEKYFIDRDTYLLKKITQKSNTKPRSGGGFIETVMILEDYRDIQGLKIPFSINSNNIITANVIKAELLPLDQKLFESY